MRRCGHGTRAFAKHSRSEPDAPAGQVLRRSLAEQAREALVQGRARKSHLARQVVDAPGLLGARVQQAQRLADKAVAQSGEPSGGPLRQRLQVAARDMHCAPRSFTFRYRSPEHWIEFFRQSYGPMRKACGALEAPERDALAQDLLGLLRGLSQAGAGSLRIPGECLEVRIPKA